MRNLLLAFGLLLTVGLMMLLLSAKDSSAPAAAPSQAALANSNNESATSRAEGNQSRSSTAANRVLGSGERISAGHQINFEVLLEIGARIAEAQMSEAQNELDALLNRLNALSDAEKFAFMEYFVVKLDGQVFNPEAVVAFNQLWLQLELTDETRLSAAEILGPAYFTYYENEFAITQYEVIERLTASLSSEQNQQLSRAHSRMGAATAAIPYLEAYIETELVSGGEIPRRDFSNLFDAYYQTGDYSKAESIGLTALQRFDDIQDWKDLQLFYESIDDREGLARHREKAREQGHMSRDGDWIE